MPISNVTDTNKPRKTVPLKPEAMKIPKPKKRIIAV